MLLLWIIYVFSVLFLLCFRARLFIDALWSPAGKGLTSWLLFVMSNCEVVSFPLVSWVRCGAWLYRFLIFALFLTLLCGIFHFYSNFNRTFFKQTVETLIRHRVLICVCTVSLCPTKRSLGLYGLSRPKQVTLGTSILHILVSCTIYLASHCRIINFFIWCCSHALSLAYRTHIASVLWSWNDLVFIFLRTDARRTRNHNSSPWAFGSGKLKTHVN